MNFERKLCGARVTDAYEKAGQPYLRLEPYRERTIKRKAGVLKGQIWIAPDFDETPQEVIDAFYNSKIFPDEDE